MFTCILQARVQFLFTLPRINLDSYLILNQYNSITLSILLISVMQISCAEVLKTISEVFQLILEHFRNFTQMGRDPQINFILWIEYSINLANKFFSVMRIILHLLQYQLYFSVHSSQTVLRRAYINLNISVSDASNESE